VALFSLSRFEQRAIVCVSYLQMANLYHFGTGRDGMVQQIQDVLSRIDWGVVIGFVALVFTAMSLQIQRKHNRLSVKPIAIISIGDYENELAVYLQNRGTGPLIIKNLFFTDQSGRKEKALIDFFGSDFMDVLWSTFIADIDGWAILPGETKTLIKLNGDPSDENFAVVREKVRKVLATIQVELHYQDIYGNDMPEKIRRLDFFARHAG